MHRYYGDILDRIPMEPLWWDENAVPRYCEFSPDAIANIYAQEAVLLLVSCQFGHHFKVALSRQNNEADLATEIRNKTIHYGDPPRGRGCGDGELNSIPIQVLQYWHRNGKQYIGDWLRDKALEIEVLEPGFETYRNLDNSGERG